MAASHYRRPPRPPDLEERISYFAPAALDPYVATNRVEFFAVDRTVLDRGLVLTAPGMLLILAGALGLTSPGPRLSRAPFGHLADGTPVDGYTIRNARGTTMHVITYGAIITSLRTRDHDQHFDDIV